MKIDIVRAIGAVGRQVVSRQRDGRPARAVVLSRTYDTTIDDVWDALTNRERIPRWFLPISGELRVGGRYELKGNASGEITRCEPPRQLAVTWEYGGNVSWVNVALAEEPGGGTRLELEHVMHVDAHWAEFGAGATGVGWDLAIVGLAEHLSTGATIDRKAADAWSASAQGKAFMRLSSDEWCRASIAGGADEANAKAAGARTSAAYTEEGADAHAETVES